MKESGEADEATKEGITSQYGIPEGDVEETGLGGVGVGQTRTDSKTLE